MKGSAIKLKIDVKILGCDGKEQPRLLYLLELFFRIEEETLSKTTKAKGMTTTGEAAINENVKKKYEMMLTRIRENYQRTKKSKQPKVF